MRKLKSILIAIFLIYSAALFAGQEALVIIDLQPFFAQRADYEKYPENVDRAMELLKNSVEAIELAKSKNLPIILVEYDEVGPSFKEITEALKGYKNQIKIEKTTDGLFDEKNKSLDKVKKYLKSKKVDTLIMIGANGDACVLQSIDGAITNNYNVLAYTKAIADFNYQKIIFPYKSRYEGVKRFTEPNCADCVFKSILSISHLDFYIGRELKKKVSATSIDDSARGTLKEISGSAAPVVQQSTSTTGK